MTLLINALLAAQNETGKHISKGTGIGIIVGIVIVATVAIVALCAVVVWALRGPVARRPHRRGHAGRV